MYINTKTKKYPLSILDIKRENPNTSFPEPFSVNGTVYKEVIASPYPTHDPITHTVEEVAPVKDQDGVYRQTWLIKKLSTEDAERNESYRKSEFQQMIAQRRYEEEVRGVSVNGLTITTDDRSKTLLNGAALRATIDPSHTRQWKISPDVWVTLDAETLIAAAVAVDNHVQNCFNREEELLKAVNDGTFTLDMLDTGWSFSA